MVSLLARPKSQLPYLDIQREVGLLAGALDLDLRRVSPKPVQRRLHLRGSDQEGCARYQCSYGRVGALHEVRVLGLS